MTNEPDHPSRRSTIKSIGAGIVPFSYSISDTDPTQLSLERTPTEHSLPAPQNTMVRRRDLDGDALLFAERSEVAESTLATMLEVPLSLLTGADFYERVYKPVPKCNEQFETDEWRDIEPPGSFLCLTHGAVRWPKSVSSANISEIQSVVADSLRSRADKFSVETKFQHNPTKHGYEWQFDLYDSMSEHWRLTSLLDDHYLHIISLTVFEEQMPTTSQIATLGKVSHIRTVAPGLARPLGDESTEATTTRA